MIMEGIQVKNSFQESSGYKTVYEADPSAVIRKEEDGIVAKSQYTEEEALWNQYMKQYRDSLKIVDGTIFLTSPNILVSQKMIPWRRST